MQRSAVLAHLLALSSLSLLPIGTGCQPKTQGGDDQDMRVPAADLQVPPDLTPPQCAAADYQAKQDPAALLVMLDRSSSMAQNGKWTAAAQAIIQTLDQDIFDSMSVGLLAAPSGSVAGPMCIGGFPVSCVSPPFAQIGLQLAGSQKSTAASGVRHDIKSWFGSNNPDNGMATPRRSTTRSTPPSRS